MGSVPRSPRDGGVSYYPADAQDLDSYRQAEADLARMRIPVLLHTSDPHQRLFIAALDGTGNSMFKDKPEHWSVVAKVAHQVEELQRQGPNNVAGGYVEGTFTQTGLWKSPTRLLDGRFGHTFDERVETAYFQLCKQAERWLKEDPQAQIRVVGVGFSRGAEQVAALQRLVHERGIRDPKEASVTQNREELVTHIRYADRPLLVQPGLTAQAALLFDPVSTGVREHDRRLPPSTLSVLQITAQDERRNLFPASVHLPPGFSEGERHYHAVVGGSHSDIGDTYARNGLGTLSFNLGVGFLNRLSDQPYLRPRPLPEDPARFVVHRSEQHMRGLYGTGRYDRQGERGQVDLLGPAAPCRTEAVNHCRQKGPVDEQLEKAVERPPQPTSSTRPGRGPDAAFLDGVVGRLYRSLLTGDDRGLSAAIDDYLRHPTSQSFRDAVALGQARLETQAATPSLRQDPPQAETAAPPVQAPPVLRR